MKTKVNTYPIDLIKYIGGQKVNDWEILGEKIYRMRPENYMIEEWRRKHKEKIMAG